MTIESRPFKRLSPSRRFREKFAREVAGLALPEGPGHASPVTQDDLAALPPPAQRLMRFARVVGRARDWSFCARWDARFRMGPDKPWMAAEAWQYNSNREVARVFHMRLRFGGIVPTYVRDLYVRGAGHMVGRLFDTFAIVDDQSDKITTGELVTYLNDAVLFAPSMLLTPSIEWIPVDDGSFDVALRDRGTRVVARVFVDGSGAVTDFSTTDRFGEDPAHRDAGMVRTRWSTPVDAWTLAGERPRPAALRVIWHFPAGDYCYAEPSTAHMDLRFNVSPRQVLVEEPRSAAT